MMRACIFVDGENLRHTICDLFPRDFNANDYLPKKADWTAFFDHIVGEVGNSDAQRLRTYWYVIQHLDVMPRKLLHPRDEHDSDFGRLTGLLKKERQFKERLNSLSGRPQYDEAMKIKDELQKRKQSMVNRFNGWQVVQDGISTRHDRVEFRRAGYMRYDLLKGRLGDEKAVDVKLATDLLLLKDNYDLGIIVSGDQDYLPAVQAAKDAGKTIVNVAFKQRNGRLLPGGAVRLNQTTDAHYEMEFNDAIRLLSI